MCIPDPSLAAGAFAARAERRYNGDVRAVADGRGMLWQTRRDGQAG